MVGILGEQVYVCLLRSKSHFLQWNLLSGNCIGRQPGISLLGRAHLQMNYEQNPENILQKAWDIKRFLLTLDGLIEQIQ